ncbi:Tn3 family transposase [Burkholderia cenocepacia]|nr:Tn3 family transposase [Burkholderia cenocepacia]MCA7967466.1 Tn3 family transposase [Burkholderia cenocepacia]
MKKRFTEEQIIGFLREAEAGIPIKELCRRHGFSEASYYLWRSKFGGEVIAENIRHEQRKVIKYNQLVANMVILYNVQWMSRTLKALQEKGHPVDADVLQALSPYRRDHINRLGSYLLDLHRKAPPLDPTIDFSFNQPLKHFLEKISRIPADPRLWSPTASSRFTKNGPSAYRGSCSHSAW